MSDDEQVTLFSVDATEVIEGYNREQINHARVTAALTRRAVTAEAGWVGASRRIQELEAHLEELTSRFSEEKDEE